MSNLTPEVRTDKNGVAVTRHIRPTNIHQNTSRLTGFDAPPRGVDGEVELTFGDLVSNPDSIAEQAAFHTVLGYLIHSSESTRPWEFVMGKAEKTPENVELFSRRQTDYLLNTDDPEMLKSLSEVASDIAFDRAHVTAYDLGIETPYDEGFEALWDGSESYRNDFGGNSASSELSVMADIAVLEAEIADAEQKYGGLSEEDRHAEDFNRSMRRSSLLSLQRQIETHGRSNPANRVAVTRKGS